MECLIQRFIRILQILLDPQLILQKTYRSIYKQNRFFDSDKIDTDILFKDLLSEVHKITGIDFRTYKSNTLARRIQKRMDILGIIRLDDYKNILLQTKMKQLFCIKSLW